MRRRSEGGQVHAKGTGMQKYRVVGDAVVLERVLQLSPNGGVALFVLLFSACTKGARGEKEGPLDGGEGEERAVEYCLR